MRYAVSAAVAVLLLFAGSAYAASPLAPAAGSAFTTTDVVTFKAEVGTDDRDYAFLFSEGAELDLNRWFTFGPSGKDEVDLGWLAAKFDHLGTFAWSVCPVEGPDSDYVVLIDECSPSWTFSVRFRLPSLTRAVARSDARYVMDRRFRSYWRGGYNRKVSCAPVTRTRQRCKVSVVVGDIVLWGRVTVYAKRIGTFALDYYHARINILNEYCYLVNKRPLSECKTTRRRSGSVY